MAIPGQYHYPVDPTTGLPSGGGAPPPVTTPPPTPTQTGNGWLHGLFGQLLGGGNGYGSPGEEKPEGPEGKSMLQPWQVGTWMDPAVIAAANTIDPATGKRKGIPASAYSVNPATYQTMNQNFMEHRGQNPGRQVFGGLFDNGANHTGLHELMMNLVGGDVSKLPDWAQAFAAQQAPQGLTHGTWGLGGLGGAPGTPSSGASGTSGSSAAAPTAASSPTAANGLSWLSALFGRR